MLWAGKYLIRRALLTVIKISFQLFTRRIEVGDLLCIRAAYQVVKKKVGK